MNSLLILFLASVGLNILMFLPAFFFKTDKLTDLSYALSFILLSIIALSSERFSFPNVVIGFMILLWSLRLGMFLFIRINKMKKDKRFDDMRESFTGFLKFWILQGASVWIILLPALMFIFSSEKNIFWPGVIIWIIGILIESIADYQKFVFKNSAHNNGLFISTGLWKYSRHPNYFGEILCWVGVYMASLPSLTIIQQSIGLISPLYITILLLFVTGVPQLEQYADKKWGSRKRYQEYKRKTSLLIPWFTKK
ncbi:MAG: DUF1295 domain-containing protein [Nanobdellota archaeon]